MLCHDKNAGCVGRDAHWPMTSRPFSTRFVERLRCLNTVTMTIAWLRLECAFISVAAKMRFWSPRCRIFRQSCVLRTCNFQLALLTAPLML
jgi:hypothetical protein